LSSFGGELNQKKTEPPGNEASLNFVSLRSLCDFLGRGGLSRVKMNALRAPLTALPVCGESCVHFSILSVFFLVLLLDRADAFIDGYWIEHGRLGGSLVTRAPHTVVNCPYRGGAT
jgi:hypothetical protein